MTIFGLEPIIAAITFTILGGGLQLTLGFLGTTDAFNWKKGLSTAIVTSFVGVIGVSTALATIAETATDLEILIIVGMAVASVAGFDGLKNSVIKATHRGKQ